MHIDVASIIQSKKPKLYRWLPPFVIRWIGRIIYQKEINGVLERLDGKKDIDFIRGTLDDLRIERSYAGLEHLDPGKRYIIASNHPLGGVDGLALAEAVNSRMRHGVKVMVNDILMNLTPMSGIFVPINKYGRQSEENVRKLNDALNGDASMIYFPAGICSRRIKGKITDPGWKKNFVQKALETRRDIVPVFVDERNSGFFYGLSNFRKAIGLKVNIEMLLLPGELFKRRGGHIRIRFGEPIPYETLAQSNRTPQEWAAVIREKSYALGAAGKTNKTKRTK